MKKTTLFIIPLLFIIALGSGCSKNTAETSQNTTNTLSIVASFYPLAYLAEEIGGEYASVHNVTPVGVDAHDFEPTAKDIATINESALFVYQGQGIDPWAERVALDAESQGSTVVEVTDSLSLMPAGHEDEHEDEHSHEEFDPHTWLDPVQMQKTAEIIRDAYITADPEHANVYTERTATLIAELKTLDSEISTSLSSCKLNTIVVSHDAFGYLANRYNFTTLAIAGISPTEEPSAQQIAEISEVVKKEGINYLFTETLVSEKFANTIAEETGAEVLTLHPLEGLTEEEFSAGKNYLSIMKENATNLATAMQCQ